MSWLKSLGGSSDGDNVTSPFRILNIVFLDSQIGTVNPAIVAARPQMRERSTIYALELARRPTVGVRCAWNETPSDTPAIARVFDRSYAMLYVIYGESNHVKYIKIEIEICTRPATC